MPLSATDRRLIDEFRSRVEQRFAADARFAAAARDDRPDESTLASRFRIGEKFWLELAVRPFIPQVRAGILTDDRWSNEDLEDAVESSGDTMAEFVELGMEEAGLTWPEPIVEHYRDQGKYFYFATALPLESLGALHEPATLDKALRMLEGYYQAFRVPLEKAAAAARP